MALVIATLLAVFLGFRWVEQSQFERSMAEVRGLVARNQYETARSILITLTRRRPQDGEALYQLGVCASRLGKDQFAREAWDAVPVRSSFAGMAAVQRARQELAYHRFTEAEVLMSRALGERGTHAREAAETLVHLFKIEGRFREAKRLVRASWDRYPDPIGVLKELAQLDSLNPYPVTRAREMLERAGSTSPQDDRVWLGFANLALRHGDFDEAERWLVRCEARRTDDEAVLRCRLNKAMASNDLSTVKQTLAHSQVNALDPDEALRIISWVEERSDDAEAEYAALSRLAQAAPDDPRALERLSELALRAGDAAAAVSLRTRKAELDRARSAYDDLLFQPDASSRASRLAELAETMRRPLEARILWKLQLVRRPGDRRAGEGLARARALAESLGVPSSTLSDIRSMLANAEDRHPATSKGGPAISPDNPTIAAAAPSICGNPPYFEDGAAAMGLTFRFDNGLEPLHHLPETTSGGVGLLDFDRDGWMDVYLVQGGPFPPDPAALGGDRLFRNRGDGTFEDVSVPSRIASLTRGYGHGVTVADYDNDGFPDLFLTRWRRYALFRNRGDGTFEDRTVAAGLDGDRDFPTSAAFADLDGDGDLDLYVCHYGVWDTENPALCPRSSGKDRYQYCDPRSIPPRPDHLFRNDGGRFSDITTEAGIVDADGRGLGVLANDFDADGRVDLFVTNDTTANYLFRNLGGFRFEEVGHQAGVASNANGGYQASMGVTCGDLNRDGRPDLAITNFLNESMTLYQNLGKGLFADATSAVGLSLPTANTLGFGTEFLDANNDGNLDLAVANGHINDLRPEVPHRMPAQLLMGDGNGRLMDISNQAGPPWKVLRIGRGLATGDLDNDGRVDILIVGQNDPVALFHNRSRSGHSLTLRLEGLRSNRDAIGAIARVRTGATLQTRYRTGGGSFQSASDQRLHFGLGSAQVADQVEILWPTGRVERFENVPADQIYLIREGEENPRPLPKPCTRDAHAPPIP